MKERAILHRMPHKKVLEEFLAGLEGHPTVIYNKESGRFERVDDPRPLCEYCGEPMEKRGEMAYCAKDRIYFNWD